MRVERGVAQGTREREAAERVEGEQQHVQEAEAAAVKRRHQQGGAKEKEQQGH